MSEKTLVQDVIPGILTGGIYNAGKAGYNVLNAPAQRALEAQKKLEDQRAKELHDQAFARERAAQAAATSGASFGTRTSFIGSFGAGSGDTPTGVGFGQLSGLGGSAGAQR